MSIESIREFIKKKAEQFGAKDDHKSYIERNNTSAEALQDKGAFFGFIHPEEEASGPYHDFSLVVFPSHQEKAWLICLCIGSSGFKNDYELASFPGVRRLFSKLVNEKGFCKTDFSDLETGIPKSISKHTELEHLKNTIKTYSKVLPVCQIIESPENEEGQRTILGFVAAYARLREWPSNQEQRKAVSDALKPFETTSSTKDIDEITDLIKERKFVVLQGPPGTGKTRAAKEVSKKLNAKTYFTQFHAETTYSDFIHGIRPNVNTTDLSYTEKIGSFSEALQYAIAKPEEACLLIIDEINRANLSNVLGPIFYLFEYKMSTSDIEIEIYPNFKIKELPQNFMVIASMNTADRSLAVVDFALRRRFAWYNMKPQIINDPQFRKEEFIEMQEIFNWYASSDELQLQPGQGYFIASNESEMKKRIRYEIMPLIKEYLQEGLMRNAKEEFDLFFKNTIQQSLFE